MTLADYLRNLRRSRARISRPYDQALLDRLSVEIADERADRDAMMTVLRDRQQGRK